MIRRTIYQPASSTLRPAVFLDRDGTLNEYRGYITEPGQIELCQGAAAALCVLRAAGFSCVLVTNQSAIGRGMLTEDGLALIHDALRRQLTADGARLDAIYWCPDAPAVDDETIIENLDRKPGPGMLLRAAEELHLDLSQSWMIGDRLSDMLAGHHAGCRGCLGIRSSCPESGRWPAEQSRFVETGSLVEAVALILSQGSDQRRPSQPDMAGGLMAPGGDRSLAPECS